MKPFNSNVLGCFFNSILIIVLVVNNCFFEYSYGDASENILKLIHDIY